MRGWLVAAVGVLLVGLVVPAARADPSAEDCAAGYVRLTFDDGPNPSATPVILDTLAARGVPATFFVVGSLVAAHPGIVRREDAEGHRIGNHSWSHPDLTTLDSAAVRAQLRRTNEVVKEVTGSTPTRWRPPYGATNRKVKKAARAVGLEKMVLWTVDPRDWADPPAEIVRDRVLAAVQPDAVILLHDGTGQNTPEALPMILDGLAERGYCPRR
jgi:peptidoglycan/xylan/chitin deacetylase (PgdA/CDA1 family)